MAEPLHVYVDALRQAQAEYDAAYVMVEEAEEALRVAQTHIQVCEKRRYDAAKALVKAGGLREN